MAAAAAGGASESTEAYVPVTEDAVSCNGYLHKLSREGRWQKRWFETHGTFMTYYKSRKMVKLLAALSLPQTGAISLVDPNDDSVEGNNGALFTLELNDRVYTLRAETREAAEHWVDVLQQLKAGANADLPIVNEKTGAASPGAAAGGASAARTVNANGGDAAASNAEPTPGEWQKEKRGCCGCC